MKSRWSKVAIFTTRWAAGWQNGLTVQAYTVNPQTERVKMYWQKANGEAWGTLHALLADMNSQGQVQMAMNGGIYDEGDAANLLI